MLWKSCLISLSLVLSGCSSIEETCRDVRPVFVFESEAPITETIELDSDDAAIRYLAMRDALTGTVSSDSHESNLDRWDQFTATLSNDPDIEDTSAYVTYLNETQWLFDLAYQTSRFEKFDSFNQPIGYFEARGGEDDPRNKLFKTLRLLVITLADDAHRHWIEENHQIALNRISTIIQISKQIQNRPNSTDLDILMAIAIADIGTDRIERMLDSGNATAHDKQTMLDQLSLLQGNDPLGLYCVRTRTIRSYQAWLKAQLEEENGTLELWFFIARFYGMHELVNQLIDGPVGVPISISFTDINAPKDAKTVNDSIDLQTIVDEVLSGLEGIDIHAIRNAYAQYELFVGTILSELDSGNPDIGILETIKAQTEDDETTVSGILGLTSTARMVKNNQRMLSNRNRLLARLQSE